MKKFLIGLALVAALFLLSVLSATLTVNLGSRGEEMVMPDLRGMQVVPAIEVLEKLGLYLKINGKEYDDSLPLGAIISQQPAAGGMVRKGRSVETMISVGPRRVAVPELRGDFILRVQSIILENGLKIGRVSRIASRLVPKDSIIGQFPAPPALVEKNTGIDLLICSGPPNILYVMPDFIGRSLAESVKMAQDAGIEISQVAYQEYPGVAPGTVVGQKPGLGTPTASGDPIELSVVRSRTAAEQRKTRYSLLSFYVPEGFRPRKVKVVIEGERHTYDAVNESRPAGDRVQVLVEVDGRTKASIFIDDRLQDTRYF
jgi:eukaryotic-like serine/threonine-protein kinase